ncbi:radial spoke head protein 9 homolog [Photinus pyralis]|uniref:radial spoke head protein 9 homolog n=1 Tax=Photinus pyralis TaxID=7054 RepID=UPI0012675768|nr:radial spoke head protein 9 homolog [Photinus pyralis]XP_031341904.1 radial spoke head protein 9 homolog [Photinus pyralis]
MNLSSLANSLDTLGYYGQVISTEETMVLTNTLLFLQNENHFHNVFFWGRIFGAEKDYFVAFGYVKNALEGKIYYYSTNCMDWGLLPTPTEEAISLLPLCTTRFQGNPALLIEILIDKDDDVLSTKSNKPTVRKLKEEDRLSATVHAITNEAMIVPRGALFKRPDAVVVENQNFEGLSQLDSQELACYLHYRSPQRKWNTNLLARIDYNYALDFLDTIDVDIPEGCWILHVCAAGAVVIINSLYWPGMVFYHTVRTPNYGSVYFGDGKRSLDLPFMLNPV